MGFWGKILSRGGRAPSPGGRVACHPPTEAEAARAGASAVPEDGFAPFARALGVEPPPPLPEDPVDPDPRDLALAETVLAAYRARPEGPASTPAASLRVLNVVANPDADVAELARIVQADPALTAGVLNVANSVAMRGVDEIETVREAIARLGLAEVGRVAGALSAKSLFQPRLRAGLHAFAPRFEALYRRALVVATAASAIALRRHGARADRVYLGGLLHDVGRAVALQTIAELVVDGALDVARDDARVDRAVELVHLELGGEVHQAWRLPHYLTVIAVRHHDREIPPDSEFVDLHVVRLAGALHDLRTEPGHAARAAHEILQSAGALGMDPHAVRAAAGELKQAEQRLAATFALEALR